MTTVPEQRSGPILFALHCRIAMNKKSRLHRSKFFGPVQTNIPQALKEAIHTSPGWRPGYLVPAVPKPWKGDTYSDMCRPFRAFSCFVFWHGLRGFFLLCFLRPGSGRGNWLIIKNFSLDFYQKTRQYRIFWYQKERYWPVGGYRVSVGGYRGLWIRVGVFYLKNKKMSIWPYATYLLNWLSG